MSLYIKNGHNKLEKEEIEHGTYNTMLFGTRGFLLVFA